MDIPEFFVDRYLERAELSVELVHACIHRGHLRRSVSYVAAAAAQAAAVAAIHRDVTLKAAVTCSLQRAGQLVQVTAPLSGALCSASFASSGWTPNEAGGVPTELPWPHACAAPDAPTPPFAAEIATLGAPPHGGEATERDELAFGCFASSRHPRGAPGCGDGPEDRQCATRRFGRGCWPSQLPSMLITAPPPQHHNNARRPFQTEADRQHVHSPASSAARVKSSPLPASGARSARTVSRERPASKRPSVWKGPMLPMVRPA